MELNPRIGGNLKLLRQSTNADRKRLKIAFSIANCRFRLPICNIKRCFNAYRSALLDSRDSSRLPPIRCVKTPINRNELKLIPKTRKYNMRYDNRFKGNATVPCHEIMVLSVLRKFILQTRMSGHPVGQDV